MDWIWSLIILGVAWNAFAAPKMAYSNS